jgi:hypothetical protein
MVFSLCFVFYFYVPPFGIKLLVVQKHKSVSKNFQLKRNSNVRTDPKNPLILCNLPLVKSWFLCFCTEQHFNENSPWLGSATVICKKGCRCTRRKPPTCRNYCCIEYTLPVQVGTNNIMIIVIILSRHLNSVSTACDKHKIKDIHPNLPSVVCMWSHVLFTLFVFACVVVSNT